jgi:3-oxoacyl-[acyl-carrier protein] reductase
MTDSESVPGRVALVTGVSRLRGIAAAVARKLAGTGWNIGMSGWPEYDASLPWGADPQGPQQILGDLTAHGCRAIYVPADLSVASAPSELFDQVREALGPISALVAVHTYDPGGGLFHITADEFDRHMAISPRATLLLMAEFARRYSGPPGLGRIVTFTSGLPLQGSIAYAASKGAIEWITISAAAELASRGITANAVNPGPNDTGWMDDHTREQLAGQSPPGRVGTPADAAELVAFLCSENSGWITGQIINCDGGWSTLRA